MTFKVLLFVKTAMPKPKPASERVKPIGEEALLPPADLFYTNKYTADS